LNEEKILTKWKKGAGLSPEEAEATLERMVAPTNYKIRIAL